MMDNKNILLKFMEEIVIELSLLSEADISKLESGGYSLSLKVVKNKKTPIKRVEINEETKNEILKQFKECKTREEGLQILSKNLKNKKDLTSFAKLLDVSVLKQDKIDTIKEKIIESTIGAVLRSNAIQDKVV